jgi:hypothetical protein
MLKKTRSGTSAELLRKILGPDTDINLDRGCVVESSKTLSNYRVVKAAENHHLTPPYLAFQSSRENAKRKLLVWEAHI